MKIIYDFFFRLKRLRTHLGRHLLKNVNYYTFKRKKKKLTKDIRLKYLCVRAMRLFLNF